MKIKRKTKPVKIGNVRASSGNDAEVYVFPARGNYQPARLRWKNPHPSDQDILDTQDEVMEMIAIHTGRKLRSPVHFGGMSEEEFDDIVDRQVQADNAPNN